jgi:hypothetical protein
MSRVNDLLNSVAETYNGTKRSDLKDSDFLFPENRSFPIVTPADVPHAINNFGRMGGDMSYDTFLHKLYNMCKRKGPEFIAALPDASKEKLGIKSKSDQNPQIVTDTPPLDSPDLILVLKPDQMDMAGDTPNNSPLDYTDDSADMQIENEDSLLKKELLEMSVASLRAICAHTQGILSKVDDQDEDVMENLTEAWLQGKIAITEDYVRNIHDFVMFAESDDDENESSVSGSKPGLWDNIRKKKMKEGKNYKPAKPGDKDRPAPDQWKKLTK